MRRNALCAAAVVSAFLIVSGASAQPVSGLYIAGAVGASFLQDQGTKPADTAIIVPRTFVFDPGFAGNASIGYGLGNGFRFEIEGEILQNGVDTIKNVPFAGHAVGSERQYGGFLNGFYDFNVGLPVFPSIGLGAGYQVVQLVGVASGGAAVPLPSNSATQTRENFAYQGILGVSYPIPPVPNLSLTAEYRLVGVPGGAVFPRRASGTKLSTHVTFQDMLSHQVLLGVRYAFGAVPAPTPPAPVAAQAAVPAPAAVRSYLVFFDWDSADLTSRARQIVAEAASAFPHVQTTRIAVNGYTDRSGSPAYNQGLSLRRAQSVAAELVNDGVPRGEIAIAGLGESHPLVPTGAGVREAQNRRVEIIVQ